MDLQERAYTLEQARELDRALEAQYRADKAHPAPAHELEPWERVSREAAEHRFGSNRRPKH
jgi:hypothetical protein